MKKLIIIAFMLLSFASYAQRISDLPAATTLGGTEVVAGVQGGTTKKISINQINAYVNTTANFWKNAGTTTLTVPVLVTSSDSIGIAATDGINLRGGPDVVSSVMTGDPGNLNYAQTGVYRDATFGNYAFLAAASTGASVIARVDVQSWPGGESSADINADTIHLSLDEVNVLKVVPSGAWQVGASEDPGTSGYVLQSNGAVAAPTWVPGVTNTSSALTDGAAITITGPKHTLTSTQATVTWTLSQTQDFQTTDIILNATSTTWTFPAGALCVVDGVASGTNTAALSGVSGDHHIMSIYKDGTNYRIAIKNFGQ